MELHHTIEGNYMTCKITGQFTFGDHAKFKTILITLENTATVNSVTIDLSGTEFIDSAGLGMLLMLRDHCNHNKRNLTLKSAHSQVKKVFDISKFNHIFNMVA